MSYTGSTRGQQKSPESGHGIDWLDGLVDWLTDTMESVGDNSRCTVGISTLLGRLSDWLRCVASGGLLVNGDVTTTSCDEKVEDNQGHGFGSRNQKETVRIQNAEYEVMQCTECLEVLAMQLQYLLFPKLTRQVYMFQSVSNNVWASCV
ncbi:uncharacterized protein LOC134176346 [Corticium candelabrum]|uniref:uncharacterized protein LOC134176346 n=1 Tax=Corticium candelabrum TaxID=121492 RepID=UPI002E26FD97|nr:uncharacterized protein LOC134176346 [Corticium candelabrum]